LKINFSRSRTARPRGDGRIRFHGQPSSGNTTIFIGGSSDHSSNPRRYQNDEPDIGVFFQTVLAQLVGGGGQQYPL
jgi:hypothetical protein